MKNKIISFLLLGILFAPRLWGADELSSHWTFDPAAYAYDMNVHAALSFNGSNVDDYTTVELAAFCGNECRGVAKALTASGKNYYQLRIYSQTGTGDVITFKCYDSATNKELKVAETLVFDGEQHGTLSNLLQLSMIQPVTEVRLDKLTLTLNTTETAILVATVSPSDASNKSVTWKSSDPAVATVSDAGLVTGIKAGKTTITVTTVDGNFTSGCLLTVLQPVTGVSLDKTTLTLNTTKTAMLIATVSPSDASNKSVTWKSSDIAVATVSSEGLITALKAGKSTITVTTVDGNFSANCELTVLQPVTGVSLDKTTLTLNTTETAMLIATVSPSDASNKSVTWESSDIAVATVSAEGLITALKAGKSTITVTTVDGNFTANCELTVLQPVTGVSLDKSTLTLNTTETATLVATVSPSDASNKSVTWKSSDIAVATVSAEGLITALKAGKSTITVTTVDGNFSTSCELTVLQPVTGVSLDKTTLTLNTTETATLVATVSPSDASNKSVTWKSSDIAVATVSSEGLIIALKAGKSTITVTTVDGNFSTNCELTVLQPVTSVSLDRSILTLNTTETATLVATVSPSDASNKSVTWESSDIAVATVSAEGLITALKAGKSTITVTTVDGNFSASCELTVLQPVTGVSLDRSILTLNTTETATLVATVSPSDASNKSVTWESSDIAVATVSSEGLVTALKAGKSTITVTTVDGNFTASCELTVLQPVTGIKLSETEMTLKILDNKTLIATVTPSDASDKSVIWRSGDEDIAIVDQEGKVTAIAVGKTEIIVKTVDGAYEAICQLTVEPILAVSVEITCEEGKLELTPNQKILHFSAYILPENTTNKEIHWSVEQGEDMVTITQDGVLHATEIDKEGTVVIRATVIGQEKIYSEKTVEIKGFATGIYNPESAQSVFITSPFKDYMTLQGNIDSVEYISIVDVSGKIVMTINSSLITDKVDCSALRKGVYCAMIKTKTGVIKQKLLKVD